MNKTVQRSVALGALLLPLSTPTFAKYTELDELRDMMSTMQERVAELEARFDQPPVVFSGNNTVKVTLSGQVNRAVLFADNHNNSEIFHVDNDNSSTRFRILGEAQFNDDIRVGTNIELQIESNSTSEIEFNEGSNDIGLSDRKLEIFVHSETYGTITFGQGSTASDGTSEIDLSDTDVIAYSGVGDLASGLNFFDDQVNDDDATPDIGDAFSNFDGAGRDDRFRYDTPRFSGFSLAASSLDNGDWDVAGRYSQEFNGTKVAAAVGYAHLTNDDENRDRTSTSASVLFECGLNLTLSWAQQDDDRDGRVAENMYAKLGYISHPTDLGSTAVSVDVAKTQDLNEENDDAYGWGVFVVQNITKIATQVYGGYRVYTLDSNGNDFRSLHVGALGARVKF